MLGVQCGSGLCRVNVGCGCGSETCVGVVCGCGM